MKNPDAPVPGLLRGTGISSMTLDLADRAPEHVSPRAVALLAASRGAGNRPDGAPSELAEILAEIRKPDSDFFELYRRYRRYTDDAYGGMDLWEVGKSQEFLEMLSRGHDGPEYFLQILTPPEDREGWALEGFLPISKTVH